MNVVSAALVAVYLAAIVAANLISAHFGAGASVYNAFFLVALTLVVRDRLHDLFREHRVAKMAALIGSGAALSYVASVTLASDALPSTVVAHIALASCAAFATAESADALMYHALRSRPWLERSNLSNIVGAALDSGVFVTIAFGWSWVIVFGQFTAKIAGGFVWSWVLQRRRDRRELATATA